MSTIVPQNKGKEIDSRTLTGAGIYPITINVEQSAIALQFFTSSMTSTSNFTIKIYNTSYLEKDELLIYDSGLILPNTPTPIEIQVPATGVLRVDIEYSGTISYTLRGKAIDAANHTAQEVALVSDESGAIKARKDILQELQHQSDLLHRMLNQLRAITHINDDEGELY